MFITLHFVSSLVRLRPGLLPEESSRYRPGSHAAGGNQEEEEGSQGSASEAEGEEGKRDRMAEDCQEEEKRRVL